MTKIHDKSAPNMEVIRMFYIEAVLRTGHKISRNMVMEKFRCSSTSASDSIGRYRRINPGVTEYYPDSKVIMAKASFTPTLTNEMSPDQVMQFINVMSEAAAVVRLAPELKREAA